MATMSTQPFPRPRAAAHDLRFAGVVVGFDGTWHSRPALERAANEAVERRLPLTVLTVVSLPSDPHLSVRAQDAEAKERWEQAMQRVTTAIADVGRAHPGLSVAVEVVREHDLDQVERDIGNASLMVLGDGGSVGPRAFLLGSTSRQLVRGLRCPILVVPDGESAARSSSAVVDASQATALTGAVLVGAGGGPAVVGLLRLAGAEALRRGNRLCVLHSYDHSPERRGDTVGTAPPPGVQTRVEQWVEAAALDAEVNVTTILTPDPPIKALARLGRSAELLVVGSRGPIAMARLVMGSVSRGVLDSAGAPILVVPHSVSEAVAVPTAESPVHG